MTKVIIVGTSGAGKSTLARNLSKVLNLADIELDALFWGPNWISTEPQEFAKKVEAAVGQHDRWVVHGNYSKIRDFVWRRGDTLIWLDYSRRVVFWRVFKRSVLRILKRETLWSGNQETFLKTFMSRDSILLWSVQTYNRRKREYGDFINRPEYSHLQIFRFKSPEETDDFVGRLSGSGAASIMEVT